MELSGYLFENIYQTNGPTHANKSLKLFGPVWLSDPYVGDLIPMKISQLAGYQWRYLEALFCPSVEHPRVLTSIGEELVLGHAFGPEPTEVASRTGTSLMVNAITFEHV